MTCSLSLSLGLVVLEASAPQTRGHIYLTVHMAAYNVLGVRHRVAAEYLH